MAAGEIKSFTGMSADAPYQEPPHPEVRLPNYKMTVDESVATLMAELRKAGVLTGGPTNPMGLPMPAGFDGEEVYHSGLLPRVSASSPNRAPPHDFC